MGLNYKSIAIRYSEKNYVKLIQHTLKEYQGNFKIFEIELLNTSNQNLWDAT